MTLDQADLRAACYEVARATGWEPSDAMAVSLDAVTPMAQRYLAITLPHAARIQEEGLDPNIVVRAVRYLGQVHAMPPMREDEDWFSDTLDALIGLVVEDSVPTGDALQFLRDVRSAINARLGRPEGPA